MPDTSKEFSLVRGRVMRVTRLDACGAPVLGPDSVVVTKGVISVALTANTQEGEAIEVTNAAGEVCISDKPAPKFLNYTAVISLCGVNPDLVRLLTGSPIVYDSQATPQGVGFRTDSAVDLSASGFALELWSGVPTNVCVGGSATYGYILFPFFKGGVLGDFTWENAAINFTINGAETKEGGGWGVGPYSNVTTNASGTLTALKTAMTATQHMHTELVTAPPPTAALGAIALGVPATSAVAGSPGSYLPANSYGPLNLAAATGLTASPTSNWTSGQYVKLRDGTNMNWNGTAWVAGIHA